MTIKFPIFRILYLTTCSLLEDDQWKKLQRTGGKENHFYSLHFGQAKASIY